jgi:hypothetical protein
MGTEKEGRAAKQGRSETFRAPSRSLEVVEVLAPPSPMAGILREPSV